jgi:hypothetical protein
MLGRVSEDPLLEVAQALYGLNHEEFTPVRDARAKELKNSDPDLSTRVRALRKPSLAAWVVNRWARREPEQVEQILSVGAALREAQAGLDGPELRALTKQRRQLTSAVTGRARELAGESGKRITDAVAEQVEATLTAGLVDARAADAVRAGLLVTALATTGLGELDLDDAVAVPTPQGYAAPPMDPPRPDLRVVAAPEPDTEAAERARAEARATWEQAEAGVAAATEASLMAADRHGRLAARAMQLQAEIDELRRRVADLEDQADQIDDDLAVIDDERREAERALAAATKAREEASAAMEKLGGGSA